LEGKSTSKKSIRINDDYELQRRGTLGLIDRQGYLEEIDVNDDDSD